MVASLGFSGILLINVLPSFAAGNPYISPTCSLSPNHGPTGTAAALSGAGFSPGVTITVSDPSGTITVSPATITTDSSGHFSATVTFVTGSAAQKITASGSDLATVSKDTATCNFAITNINSSHSTDVKNSGGSATVNDTTITGVSVSISGLGNFSGTIDVTTAGESSPGQNVGAVSGTGTLYFDVEFTVTGGSLPSGAVANICFTNPGVTSGNSLVYWDGTAWVSATNITVHGSRVCGDVPASALTGTEFAVYVPTGSAGIDFLTWGAVAVFAAVVVVGLALYLRRTRK